MDLGKGEAKIRDYYWISLVDFIYESTQIQNIRDKFVKKQTKKRNNNIDIRFVRFSKIS